MHRKGQRGARGAGTRLVLLGPDGRQSAHAPGAPPAAGEVALAPPLLGASQRLLNRDHFAVYFEVGPATAGIRFSLPSSLPASARLTAPCQVM
jgi:hypothetical protein